MRQAIDYQGCALQRVAHGGKVARCAPPDGLRRFRLAALRLCQAIML